MTEMVRLAITEVVFLLPLVCNRDPLEDRCAPFDLGNTVGLRGTRNATARIVSGVAITAGIVILLGIILVWVFFFQTSSGGGIISR